MDGKTDECLYEHNIIGGFYTGDPSRIDVPFNFTYIDNKSTCDYSDIQNALLKNPSINAWGYKELSGGGTYFIRDLVINPPTSECYVFNVEFSYTNNASFNSTTLEVEKVSDSLSSGAVARIISKITNKINNLYQ